jgi:hypothetical protein
MKEIDILSSNSVISVGEEVLDNILNDREASMINCKIETDDEYSSCYSSMKDSFPQ